MTAYGPPSGPPGSPPPPPGGGYGPPSYGGPGGYATSGSSTFDPKSVHRFDWAILGAGLLALIFSFFAFYSYEPKGVASQECGGNVGSLSSVEKSLCGGDSASAWHGFFGWFGVLLLVIAALAVAMELFAPQITLPVSLRLLGAGVAALGVLMIILSLVVIPDWPPVADLGLSSSIYDKVIDNGVGFSWYIVLILGLVITALSFLRFQQTGGTLPGRGAKATTEGFAPSGGYGQPSGYGQAPQQDYGAPTQQPGGYAPPPSAPQGPPPQSAPTQQMPVQQMPPQGPPQGPPQQMPPQGPPPGYQQPPPGYTPPPPPQH
jgi:hypothetical protein